MHVRSIVVGPFYVSCHFVTETGSGPAMIVDPGFDADDILAVVHEDGLDVRLIVNTHGHGDHIGQNERLKAEFPDAQLVAHQDAAPLLANPDLNLSALFGYRATSPAPDRLVREGDTIDLGTLSFEVIHVPGHSPGGMALGWRGADGAPGSLFTGDCLFAGSIGRTDFPGGNGRLLIDGIREKLLSWPDETIVYPGHGPATTIGDERRNNAYLAL